MVFSMVLKNVQEVWLKPVPTTGSYGPKGIREVLRLDSYVYNQLQLGLMSAVHPCETSQESVMTSLFRASSALRKKVPRIPKGLGEKIFN